jgi:uncharacterized protein
VLPVTLELAGEQIVLHPHRALWWPRMRWLIISDLHLGKAAHFRKAGIPLPEGSDEATLVRLTGLLREFEPARLVVIGDLFHSVHNRQWDLFAAWCAQCGVPVHLVPGNHDLLADRRYADACITVHGATLEAGPFLLTHEPVEHPASYVIAGHVHPGIRLNGLVHGNLRLPCFLFGRTQGLLPAFGLGTGLYMMQPGPTHRVYALTGVSVLDVTSATSRARQV